jgi:hypothetical protein
MTGMISRFVKPLPESQAGISSGGWFPERYAHVADERGQGCGEVPRRGGTAIALRQFCGYPFNVYCK